MVNRRSIKVPTKMPLRLFSCGGVKATPSWMILSQSGSDMVSSPLCHYPGSPSYRKFFRVLQEGRVAGLCKSTFSWLVKNGGDL